jgi:nicotinic acid phosphoribosyltransferase
MAAGPDQALRFLETITFTAKDLEAVRKLGHFSESFLSYLRSFRFTGEVAAGAEFGIPVYGTMAHSFIQAHDDEALAFERFAHSHPHDLVLLIDTYDTERAAERVVALAPRLRAQGVTFWVCVSTAAISARMRTVFAGSSMKVGSRTSRSSPVAAWTKMRCWR